MICEICIISKRGSSLLQTLIKIKYKVKWMLKFVKTWTLTFTPVVLTCKSSPLQLSIWERLGYIMCLHFLLIFYSIKKKCPIFLIFTASTNITIRKAKFEAGCSYKVCNKFVLSGLLLRIIVYSIKYRVSSALLTLIANLLYLVSSQTLKSQVQWNQVEFYKV